MELLQKPTSKSMDSKTEILETPMRAANTSSSNSSVKSSLVFTHETSAKDLLPHLARFTPGRDNIVVYLRDLKHNLEIFRVPQQDHPLLIWSLFRHIPSFVSNVWSKISLQSSMDDIYNLLQHQFTSESDELLDIQNLNKIIQGKRSVSEYYDQLQQLASRLGEISESFLIKKFKFGLRPKLLKDVLSYESKNTKFESLIELVEFCQTIEQNEETIHQLTRQFQHFHPRANNINKNFGDFHNVQEKFNPSTSAIVHASPTHISSPQVMLPQVVSQGLPQVVPQSTQSKNISPSTPTSLFNPSVTPVQQKFVTKSNNWANRSSDFANSFNSNNKILRVKPKQRFNRPSRQFVSAQSSSPVPASQNNVPHQANFTSSVPNSPQTQSSTQDSASKTTIMNKKFSIEEANQIVTPVILNDSFSCLAVVDTGATHSVISTKVAEDLKLPIKPVDGVIQFGDASMPRVGTTQIQIKNGDKSLFTEIEVYPLHSDAMLIGLDLFKKLDYQLSGVPFLPPKIEKDSHALDEEFLNSDDKIESTREESEVVASIDDFPKLRELIDENQRITEPVKHFTFKVTLTNEEPFLPPPTKFDNEKLEAVREIINKWEQEGKIKRSTTVNKFNSRLVAVKKANGRYRVCLDLRWLNSRIKFDGSRFLPKIWDLISSIGKFDVCSVMDLKDAYLQVPIDESCSKYFGFVFDGIQYVMTMMIFGISTAPFLMQSIMISALDSSPVKKYLDDCGLFSVGLPLHVEQLCDVIERLNNYNLRLNMEKSKFFVKEVKFLGFRINPSGVFPDDDKIQKILDFQLPSSVKELETFVGLITFNHPFSPQISDLVVRINKAKNFKRLFWTDDSIAAFDQLKQLFSQSMLLRHFDPSLELHLFTDSSDHTVSYWLGQKHDNKILPIHCGSKALTKFQQNYPILRKELFAILSAFRKYEDFLKCTPFILHVDNRSLASIFNQSELNKVLLNYLDYFMSFQFTTVYEVNNQLADHLTRNIKVSRFKSMPIDILLMGKNIPVPEDRVKLIDQFHQLGHFSTVYIVKQIFNAGYYWDTIYQDVQDFIRNCVTCNQQNVIKQGYHPSKSIVSNAVFEVISVDLLELPESAEGFKYCLTLVDNFTNFVILSALKSKQASEVAIKLHGIFCTFGWPKSLISDQGTEFVNALLERLFSLFSVQHLRITPYYSEGNGKAERLNGIIRTLLKKFLNGNFNFWHLWLEIVQLAINMKFHPRTKSSAFHLMFNRDSNYFSEEEISQNINDLSEKSLDELLQYYHDVSEVVLPAVRQNQQQYDLKLRSRLDKSRRVLKNELKPGDTVYARNLRRGSKMEPFAEGPFHVLQKNSFNSYKIADALGNTYDFNRRDLKLVESSQHSTFRDSGSNQEFVVQSILDHEVRDGKDFYLVKWVGYPHSQNTWEPEDNFTSSIPIEKYWRKRK